MITCSDEEWEFADKKKQWQSEMYPQIEPKFRFVRQLCPLLRQYLLQSGFNSHVIVVV